MGIIGIYTVRYSDSISAKIDYLTISLLPDQSGWTISEALDRLFDCLFIEEWRSWFVLVGAGYGYEFIYL